MSEIISGKEAKLMWANGLDIEFRNPKDKWYENWTNIYDAKNGFSIQEFDDTNYQFRLKPRTIKIGDVEVPAPFEPKDDDTVYYLDGGYQSGYTYLCNSCINEEHYMLGFWRNEEEIKQVVAALRQVFKGN